MAEYIEREALLKVLRGSAVAKYPASFAMGLFAAADEVSKLPAADVQTVVHGEWVHDGDGDWRRSSCRRLFTFDDYGDVHPLDDCWFNYCPTCGCRMDKDGE